MLREGYINKIIYTSSETGYSVFLVETDEGDDIFVGNVTGVAEGMYIRANGEYVHHPQYDIQFSVTEYELSMPEDIQGIERYLGSGIIKGIGEVLAKRIVKKFKDDTLRIMDEEPERLAEVRGISEKMANSIAVQFSESKSHRNIIMFLSKYGIGVQLAIKIYNHFGDEIYNIIRDNPYKIADEIPGVGFKTADSIAMKAGIPMDSDYRIRSLILYILNQSMTLGHIYIPEEWLLDKASELLFMDVEGEDIEDRIHNILMEMSMDNSVVIKKVDDKPVVYSKWNYLMELDSAKMLLDLIGIFKTPQEEIDDAIATIEAETEIELEEEQKQAVYNAVSSGVSVITGGPGTGKTTIINAIIKYFELTGCVALLAAPTGRAAKRITESTGYKAQTIHRLLEFSGEPDGESAAHFNRNRDNPLECDAVIIDEASMVDAMLFYALLKALVPGTRLIMVGDIDQLPPVGPGNILHDIISSEVFNVTTLNRIFRQAEESSIVENAHKIRNGIHLEINNKSKDFFFIPRNNGRDIAAEVNELVSDNLPKYLHVSPQEIEVLTPMRHYELGVEGLNRKLQQQINPPSPEHVEMQQGDVIFREGDKVMQIRNNYKIEWKIYGDHDNNYVMDQGVGVFNGDMGIITSINDFDEVVTVSFDDGRVAEYTFNQLDELEHSFAITIHKSQGSEYPAVVIPLLSGPKKLLSRNLLYTAVTRAREMVVVVGNLNMINEMIDNVQEQKRFTGFTERIKELNDLETT